MKIVDNGDGTGDIILDGSDSIMAVPPEILRAAEEKAEENEEDEDLKAEVDALQNFELYSLRTRVDIVSRDQLTGNEKQFYENSMKTLNGEGADQE